MSFKEVSPYELENALKLIGKDWMLITARDGERTNAMTASWGCMGVLWNRPVAVGFIRPQRYTFGLAETEDRVSLAFLDEQYRGALNICGTKSGRDCDKLMLAGLCAKEMDGVPVISEARLVLICKKLYVGDLCESGFIDKSLLSNYKNGDYHRMYVWEIERAYTKNDGE
ncbi:MAG: flavin reductase family protein [Ruminococcaceae bacterium]|nr:flavin reductase family protein [Oscillospiraceae bacterium]